MDKELFELYKKHYASSGPLRCNIIDFKVKVNGKDLISVHLDYLYSKECKGKPGDGTDILVDIRPTIMFDLYDKCRNDILSNKITKEEICDRINRIEQYWNWLQTTYIPKWVNLEDFFYRVFLWIREDLYQFCIYTGCTLDIEYSYPKDENFENIDELVIERYI